MKKWVLLRKFSQFVFFTLFSYILWATTYPLKGFLPAETFFNINPLITFFTSISERIILPGISFSFYMLLLTLIFGRFFCGWVCPLGSTIDFVGSLKRKKPDKDNLTDRKSNKIKYFILAIIGLFALLGIQLAWVFDPMVIMARFVSLNFIPSGVIFIFFLAVCGTALLIKRFWCRTLCPLGALYSLLARFSLLRRTVEDCKECKRCKSECRMGAIKDDSSYVKAECILCMDCLYNCPENATKFGWRVSNENVRIKNNGGKGDISRRNFIFLLTSSFFLFGFSNRGRGLGRRRSVIRPPAALREGEFINRCIRCGNCMKACVTNGLQPVIFQSGLEGIWTPQLVPEIGYCEYNCNLCGDVCPTGAIRRLSLKEKQSIKLGLAKIDRSICIAWAEDKQCIVCEEHCPLPDKAIKVKEEPVGDITALRPVVDERLCIGCGICQNKCPVRPVRAIKVFPDNFVLPKSF